ncbi:hypothetical protein SAMD00019534_031270 [Acytostelium subglobosum LB1]|uniref:hypothetical protein n=1 Tax=Acytostelium subglobosum LB1 TaxID=1410327 RepID=UPI000645096E|nr:hypothetical protein SAMD00019534_031270 [Acytostelium subglobosum LB1]GAM19952.1 hypothetical protein SAMD00019534_031270 [Acytostelium subglobosum LB1]|eukprot:XP_012756714.1 hypothetical protein SAMD00019534_031270 [Acytostelium subglobosum LB1]
MADVALARLAEERKSWRKDHPPDFFARPASNADGSTNLNRWDCGVPGKKGTAWENGVYPVTLVFSNDYPAKSPLCSFPAGFFHPNVFSNGDICLSIIGNDWKPSITVKQILIGIQDLLDNPNPLSPASTAITVYEKNKKEYEKKILAQAKSYLPK